MHGGHAESLWRHPGFLRLWAGKSVAELGAGIGGTALPLVGVLALSATPEQMGLLAALGEAPVLLAALPAGLLVDRVRRRPLMIAADLGRAALLLTVPLAAAAGILHMGQLYVVAALAGALTVLFGVADQAILPSIVPPERLLEGNSTLGISSAVAEIGGPSLGGALVGIIGAPASVCCQAGTFLISAASLATLRTPEAAGAAADQHPLRAIGDGLRMVLRHPVLRPLALSSACFGFFGSFIGALYNLYVVRELGLSPAILGLSIGAGGVGALIGSLLIGRLVSRFGQGRTLALALLIDGLFGLVLPAIHGPAPVAAGLLIAMQVVGDIFVAMYLIGEVSLRQALIPGHMLGRANAGVQLLSRGGAPAGALLAGVLAGRLGIRATLLIAVLGIIAGSGWLFAPSVREQR